MIRDFFADTLAFAPNRMYGHRHSTRKAWDRPGEIRAFPPVAFPKGLLFALRRFNRKRRKRHGIA
jgi:hypothetical protein